MANFSSDMLSSCDEVLRTKHKKCLICVSGDIVDQKRSEEKDFFFIYGRNGMRKAVHIEGRCNFRNKNFTCNAGYFHGYMTFQGKKIWDDDALKNRTLVTSNQTGFDIDFLYELSIDVSVSSTTFEAASKKFNMFHNQNLPMDVLEQRVELNRKRISHAHHLYSYLEYCQRHGIKDYQIFHGTLEEEVLNHKNDLINSFVEEYTVNHECDRPGCKEALVIDGGLKPHRAICGAKACGVKVFKESGTSVLTGCSSIPQPNSKFCFNHQNSDHPVLSGDKINSKNKEKLKKYKRNECPEAGEDDLFVIETILETKKTESNETSWKVKWMDYPPEEATWEDSTSIPKFIQDYYSDVSKLGTRLPEPIIKHTKVVGENQYHYLSWSGEKGGKWLDESFFNIASEDGSVMSTVRELNSCGTRKSRDKRVKDSTLGLLVGAYPCGTVIMHAELFNSEGIAQVHGIANDFLGNVSDKERLKYVIYDDACHLSLYSKNKKIAEKTETTKFFSNLKFLVDRFHFRNHTDPYCMENNDPDKVPEIKEYNTEVCEQLMRRINKHMNCKAMNESNFYLFWLYQFDFQNLDMAGLANTMANPMSEFRWNQIKIKPVDMQKVRDESALDELTKTMSSASLNETSIYKCGDCPAAFMSEAKLKSHRNIKHDVCGFQHECEHCGNKLSSNRNLENHIKTVHLTCKKCKIAFVAIEELTQHQQKEHSSERSDFQCSECDKIMTSHRNLQNHINNVHKTCKKCGKTFDTPEEKNQHVNKEHSQDNFKCTLCGNGLSTARTLANHIKTLHLTCSLCKVEFESESERLSHIQNEHKDFKGFCGICNKDFKSEPKLLKHISSHNK